MSTLASSASFHGARAVRIADTHLIDGALARITTEASTEN